MIYSLFLPNHSGILGFGELGKQRFLYEEKPVSSTGDGMKPRKPEGTPPLSTEGQPQHGGRRQRLHGDALRPRPAAVTSPERVSAPAVTCRARCARRSLRRSALGSPRRPLRSARPIPERPGSFCPGRDMSTAMNFGTKSFKPRPPDKGAFPLDHFGECSAFKERFMECLRHSGYESGACRPSAMAYLECRMERQLMANEPLEKLGFKDLIDEKSEAKPEKL
ncbi:uncharacterized protein LOC104066006 isoform X2 [Cuculus canorus]|uniref:uncharacterized protein LOC104066006 isoform X2 n=1 Tax=Cuculus canorus TaxID=55661 RepID=UPI0023AB2749|nr:uncharacterized protein LOC104066006 isoform X2 [Cuculus canorus]